jgi:FHA domain
VTSACAHCGAPDEDGAFCGRCGAPRGPDTGAPSGSSGPPARWVAVVATDRRLFEAMHAADRGFAFPSIPDLRFELTGDRLRIGRAGRRAPPPDLDLSGPPPDPGVSRAHAELLRADDGTWAVRDLGSANGTFLDVRRLAGDEVAPLTAGARIRLGLWSRITVLRE